MKNFLLTVITIIGLLVLAALGTCSQAAELEVGVGLAHANGQDCGIWYMCGPGEPYQLHLTTPSYSVGLQGANWRAGWLDLGRYGADATATGTDAEAALGAPLSQWHGKGKVRGAYLQYVAHLGAWRAEAGPWVYRATWQEDIPNWFCVRDCNGRTPGLHHLRVSNDKTSLGAVMGLGRDFGRVSAVASVAMASDRGCDRSIIKNMVVNLELRRRF